MVSHCNENCWQFLRQWRDSSLLHGWKYIRIYTEIRKIEMWIRRSPYFDNFQNKKNLKKKNCFDFVLQSGPIQGMTIRTARLPGAGNLGEDLSGLPDWASCYQFVFVFCFFYWQYISIQALDFESLWQFLFCGSTIATSVSFYIIKPTDFSVVACDWYASAVKPIRS